MHQKPPKHEITHIYYLKSPSFKQHNPMFNTFTQSWFDQLHAKCKSANGKSKLFLEFLSIASGCQSSNRSEVQCKQIAHTPYTFVFCTHMRWKSVTTSEIPVTITFSTLQFCSFSEYTLLYLSAPVVTMLLIHHTFSPRKKKRLAGYRLSCFSRNLLLF